MNCFDAAQSTSNYEGVSWNAKKKLWQAEFSFNGKTSKSYFENEFDAAKKINQLCKNMRMLSKNSELSEIQNQLVTASFLNQSFS